MTQVRVTVQGKGAQIIEIPKDLTVENWLAGIRRSDSPYVTLNNTTYLKKDIIDATEVKARHAFTNMDGV